MLLPESYSGINLRYTIPLLIATSGVWGHDLCNYRGPVYSTTLLFGIAKAGNLVSVCNLTTAGLDSSCEVTSEI